MKAVIALIAAVVFVHAATAQILVPTDAPKPQTPERGAAAFSTNAVFAVSRSAKGPAETFVATATEEGSTSATSIAGGEQVSEETFRRFIAALSRPRDLKRGHEIYLQACATCHRIGKEGFDVGPDLPGQVGMAEESLLKDILMPNERIRPGYETTVVQTADGASVTGILKDDGATSLALVLPNGVEHVLLRKDVTEVRRLSTSLMPTFAQGLSPADLANVLAWLRSNLGSGGARPTAGYFELRIYDVTRHQLAAVLERFRETVQPVREKHGIRTVGYWTARGVTNDGTFAYLMSAGSRDELQRREKEFGADPEFKKGYAASNKKHGKTVDGIAAFSLSVDATARFDFNPSQPPRVFDLRIYSVLPGRLDAFRSRWRDHAVPTYERHGLHSIGWWVAGQKDAEGHDQFVCLLAAESADAVQKAIAAFHADPEWQRVEQLTEAGGALRSGVTVLKLTPADFSELE